MKKYQDRDKKALEEKNHDTNRDNKSIKNLKKSFYFKTIAGYCSRIEMRSITHTIDTIIKCLA